MELVSVLIIGPSDFATCLLPIISCYMYFSIISRFSGDDLCSDNCTRVYICRQIFVHTHLL